jgi:anti-sigma factor RsiW
MTIPDDEVFAFVDGQLPPEAMARIEAALANDPQLALRVETQRQLRRLLAGAPAGESGGGPKGGKPAKVIAFPPPQPKAKAAPKAAPRTPPKTPPREPASVRSASSTPRPARRLPGWAPMALCLLAGLAIGRLALPPPATISGASVAPAIATGPLAQALNTRPSGAPGAVRIGATFRTANGPYCRTFQAPAGAGLACREGAVWRVRAIGPAGPTGAAMPEAVRMTASAIGGGLPLDAASEARAIKARWAVAKAR